ncbi:NADH-quinone oxidoreductase subunit D [Helicobacter monodelphidis]|uniref:NADH dehydrogenase (quinone) subunit D n=1 Tax=Helicobacter sp. 15-1451 TaxID=2004995 RepID=UPI000DCE5F74|nr:NADH dehydrogenase (quinone) subunit D [Helicobacter sp. 15-1451]RAX59292.1 NADH-quinone oxidoreductase subunit D [Helicobacter sp. 15-1451]
MQQPNRLIPYYENLHFEQQDSSMIINFGPQHPSAHGQLRLILELDGEKIVKATPDVGYLHRGMEKMAENMIYNEFIPTTDRMDYIASSSNNHAFAMSVEKLLGIQVPRRAQIIRMMILELNRIISHLFWLATHALDVGAMSVMLYCFREREWGMDLMEDYCGARLTHSSIRIGGVPLDIPDGWLKALKNFIDKLPEEVKLLDGLLKENRIWRIRLEDVGVITPELAKSWSCSGVILRGSGIQWDLRKEQPYELYNEVEFEVPYSNRCDSYGRYLVYMEELKESARIIEQLIEMYPKTDSLIMAESPQYLSAPKEQIMTQNYSLMQHFVLVTQGMRPPKGEIYCATESPKGELGFLIHSQGDPYPYRLKIRTPSFFHTGLLQDLLPGHYLADAVTIIGNLNIIFGEIDR